MTSEESLIEFQFEFTDCNGRMQMTGDGKELIPDDYGHLTVCRRIKWPSTIEFMIYGKDIKGTLLDQQGNIIRDRAIKLIQIKIDNLIPDINFLKRWPILFVGGRQGNQVINSDYFGFNGLIKFDFFAKNAMHFMIRSNQFRDNFWNKN